MINAFMVAGLVFFALGVFLVGKGLVRAVLGVVRRARYRKVPLARAGEGIWSGAMTAREVYVPGTILRGLGVAVLGLVVAALSVPLAWVGRELGPYVAVGQGARLARIDLDGPVATVASETGAGVRDRLPGAVLVGRVEVIEFKGYLAKLGLGTRARLVELDAYPDAAAVLSRREGSRLDVGASSPLFTWLTDIERRYGESARSWFHAGYRVSDPLRSRVPHAEIWAVPQGVEWRR